MLYQQEFSENHIVPKFSALTIQSSEPSKLLRLPFVRGYYSDVLQFPIYRNMCATILLRSLLRYHLFQPLLDSTSPVEHISSEKFLPNSPRFPLQIFTQRSFSHVHVFVSHSLISGLRDWWLCIIWSGKHKQEIYHKIVLIQSLLPLCIVS
jgi:hypothetical protein